ncbi:hypothetical protein F4805DRAFT_421829 [Annulohypoxylon moriforme]|nr:hypothetical protein F4805DRAFT_421829 [Annulohypoxylon moriforme]
MLTDSTFTVTQYVPTDSGTVSSLVTKFYASGNSVYGKGVVVRRASNDPPWDFAGSVQSTSPTSFESTTSTTSPIPSRSTTSSTTSSESSNGQAVQTQGTNNNNEATDRLSTGAKAGIGIGVGLGVLAIIGMVVTAYNIGKRKRQPIRREIQSQPSQGGQFQISHVRPAELDVQNGYSELGVQGQLVELMDHEYPNTEIPHNAVGKAPGYD